MILKIREIIASLVTIKKKDDNENQSYTDRTYRLVPDMIVSFAHRARVHHGYRLVIRTLQHSCDPQAESILSSYGHIVLYDNDPCFFVHHRVRASMRNEVYDADVCFDNKNIVGCGCNCKAGGENKEKVVCVHIPPIIYQMSLLLFDGLADNIIVELSHHWRNLSEKLHLLENKEIYLQEVKKSILTIISAGQQNLPEDDNLTIEQLLHNFSVGTERARLVVHPPPSLDSMRPMRDLDMRSIHKRAKDRIERRSTENVSMLVQNNIIDVTETHESPPPAYRTICKYINALKTIFPDSDSTVFDSCIGYRIIEARSSPIKIKRAGNTTRHRKDLQMLLILANREYRSKEFMVRQTKSKNVPLISETDEQQEVLVDASVAIPTENNNNIDNDQSNNPTQDVVDDGGATEEAEQESDDESINEDQNNHIVEYGAVNSNKKTRTRYCCVCEVKSSNRPQTKISYIPYTEQRDLVATDDDDIRRQHYKRIFRRKEYLRRFKKKSDRRRSLNFCDLHPLELVHVEFPWKNKQDITMYSTEEMKLPVDPDDVPNRTRLQASFRKEVPNKNNRQPKSLSSILKKKANAPDPNNRRVGKICNVVNCFNKDSVNKRIKFSWLCKLPLLSENKNHRNDLLKEHAVKTIFHNKCINRIMTGNNKENKPPPEEIRVCNQHKIERQEHMIDYLDTKKK
jgi:hypothetical protein